MDISSLLADLSNDSESDLNEPIAIIGTACRLPGGVKSLKSLTEVLIDGTEVFADLPSCMYERNQETQSAVRGGMIDDVFAFDPKLFGISPREAIAMDPQQRLALKLVWELFDDAGLTKRAYANRDVGVFVGVSENTYADRIKSALDRESTIYLPTGNALNAIAGRISHCFNLAGPSIAIDTACSSSLISICLAVNALRSNDCEMAIAGGLNVLLDEQRTELLLEVGMLSKTGRCKVFDKGANGYVRSEGAGLILLKKLSEAERNKDNILGVIRGCAFNHNCQSAGLTVPSGAAQVKVMEKALANARVDGRHVNWIEAHGTGTKLGDPIEYSSIAQVFSTKPKSTQSDQERYVTSCKSQFGHTESASGVVSILRALSVLESRCLSKQYDFDETSPEIDGIDSSVRIPTEHVRFDGGDSIRAVVNSFGFSGSNASLVVESYSAGSKAARADRGEFGIVCLSGYDQVSLIKQAAALAQSVSESTTFDSLAIESLMNARKTHLKVREAIVYSTKEDLLSKLISVDQTNQLRESVSDVVFLFSGQGSQYLGMADSLRKLLPVFDEELMSVCEKISARLGDDLIEVINTDQSEMLTSSTLYAQCAIFAVSYAFAKSMMGLGVTPRYLIGHSVGEIVACAISEVWSLDDACDIIVKRGRVMESPAARGSMLSIKADIGTVNRLVREARCDVDIAGINSGEQVVVSADDSTIRKLNDWLKEKGVPCVQLNVQYAFHSRYMEDSAEQLARYVAGKKAKPPIFSIVSTLTGEIESDRFTESSYWKEQLLGKVDFRRAMATLESLRAPIFIECGANDILINCAAKILSGNARSVYAYWERARDGGESNFRHLLCKLHNHGLDLDWSQVYLEVPRERENDFKFPHVFHETVFRPKKRNTRGEDRSASIPKYYSSPYTAYKSADCAFDLDSHRYLRHHVVFGEYVAPGAMHCCFALDAVQNLYGQSFCYEIADVYFLEAAVCYEDEPRVLQIVIEDADGEISFKTISFVESNGRFHDVVEHSKGKISVDSKARHEEILSNGSLKESLIQSKEIAGSEFYEKFKNIADIDLGPSFTWCRALDANESAAAAEFRRQEQFEKSPFLYEPGLLDACFQVIGSLPLINVSEPTTFVPFSVGRVSVYQDKAWDKAYRCLAEVTSLPTPDKPFVSGNALLQDADGNPVMSVEGLVVKKIDKPRFLRRESDSVLRSDRFKYELHECSRHPLKAFSFVDDMQEPVNHSEISAAYEQLNNLSSYYARAAIEQVSPEAIQSDTCRRLWRRLKEFAYAHSDSDADYSSIEQKVHHIKQAYPIVSNEVDLVAYCGPRLASVLSGEVLGSNVLFPENDTGVVSNIYQQSKLSKSINRRLAVTLADSIRRYDFDRPVRILEIGGGTGGTTEYVLSELEGTDLRYCFTDISPLFVNQAKEKFGERCHQYRVLDIENSPHEQGFELEAYDFVICANVIHAARDMEAALKHINMLLVNGGGGILLEGRGKQPWLDVTFGLTDGWWHFTDFRVQNSYPLIEPAEWQMLLPLCGFSSPNFAKESSEHPQIVYRFSKARPALKPKNVLLVSEDRFHSKAESLSEALKLAGNQVSKLLLAESDFDGLKIKGIDDLERKLSEGQRYSVVYLTSDSLSDIHRELDSVGATAAFRKAVSLVAVIKRHFDETVEEFVVVDNSSSDVSRSPGLLETAINTLSFETLSSDIRYFTTDELSDDLVAEYMGATASPHVVYREGKRYLRSIVPSFSEVSSELKTISGDKSYLITGARAGLSDSLIQFLVDNGAKRIDLLSRSAFNLNERPWYQSINERSVEVIAHQCDITSQAEVDRAIQAISSAGFVIDGVFHLAGLLDDALIENQSEQSLATVMNPKVVGIQNILRSLSGAELTWFVMYSSAAAMLGTPGQINHALANSFLDSLVSYRRSNGLSGQSIAWGPWGEVGAAANKAGVDSFIDKGLDKFTKAEGRAVVEEVFAQDAEYVAPIKLDWASFLNAFSDSLPGRLLNRDYITLLNNEKSQLDDRKSVTLDELNGMEPAARQEAIEDVLKQVLSSTLSIDVQSLNSGDRLQDIGLDSLTAMEVIGRLKKLYHIEIPAKKFLDNISIGTLAEVALDLLGGSRSGSAAEKDGLEGVL